MRCNADRSVRRLALTLIVGSASTFAPGPASAFVVTCVNCSTVFSQAMQYAQELETAVNTAKQYETELQQYEDMVQQGLSLPQSSFQSIANDLNQIQSLYNQSSVLAGNLSNFDSQFSSKFPDYGTYLSKVGQSPTYAQDYYSQWSTQGLAANKAAMAAAGGNVNQIVQEDATMADLVNQSQSAQGRLQAIQAGNQIAAQQVQQMQKLREMMNSQIQNESTYYAQNIQRQALDNAFTTTYQSGVVADDTSQSF